ncbi:MAG TPA: hypothetical protein VHW66_01265 [Stellaceae bacterium]|nr:hypothetical protein [Stellaceae bacterium]
MNVRNSILAGALFLAATGFAANAQTPYPSYPSYPSGPAPNAPESWSYDPYASGLGPCPQRRPGDPPCSVTFKPTYGQPSYWPTN